jgi:hypothetical protein
VTTELQSSDEIADVHASTALRGEREMALQALAVQQVGVSLAMQSDRVSATPQPLSARLQKATAMAVH